VLELIELKPLGAKDSLSDLNVLAKVFVSTGDKHLDGAGWIVLCHYEFAPLRHVGVGVAIRRANARPTDKASCSCLHMLFMPPHVHHGADRRSFADIITRVCAAAIVHSTIVHSTLSPEQANR
jgi:hypothetical protein